MTDNTGDTVSGVGRVLSVPILSSHQRTYPEVTTTSSGDRKVTMRTYTVDVYDYLGTVKTYTSTNRVNYLV
jgi:hypothetical protein